MFDHEVFHSHRACKLAYDDRQRCTVSSASTHAARILRTLLTGLAMGRKSLANSNGPHYFTRIQSRNGKDLMLQS